ncbi:inositol-trisphosphate 3-kinase B-like isoform X1 [Eriocheir sinensis]|uniref:inositol-trisphosphate 3-kinase B-like isoform X1 n=1 Tax=Eriocheir sinensis TaxID=95602 RepID=UPI0021CA1B23|nr:inositol-trisphosphate 3-kinase B-like isoform X1 [Eriocheir sinensis]
MTGGEGRSQGNTGGAGVGGECGSGQKEVEPAEREMRVQTEALMGAMKEVSLTEVAEERQKEENAEVEGEMIEQLGALEEERRKEEENADSAFEDEWSDTWLSPGLTRQNSYLESVPEHDSLSRRSSLLDEELKETLMRRHSKDYRTPLSRRGSALEDDPREPLGRRDSLLEAVLAAKTGGWRGLVRTDSMESGASLTSSVSSSLSSDGSACPCDDCFLGLTDLLLAQPPTRPKKPSNWRKVRNIVQWTPFIQTYKKHKYPWVQLAGHQGNFRAGHKQGTILKKLCPAEEKALEAIMKDILRPYVPRYSGVVEGADGEKYLQLEDLLSNYSLPCVMDIKMGVRTYLEDELAKAREKPKLRKDMYEKMIQIDSKAPTEAEHRAKAVTKPRYMVWRETISSTATQGFRIEGVRRGDGTSSKDFKTTRTREQVLACLSSFLQGYPHVASRYVQQLKSIKMTLEASPFFKAHELIGSSLLFVHNDSSALVRMIDFAKTVPLPRDVNITHRSPWSEGTHEDGYLLGLDNLIDLFSSLQKTLPPPVPLPLTTPNGTVSSNKSPLTPTSPSISSDSTSSSPTSSSSSSSKFSSSSSSFSSSSSSTISTSASFPSAPSTSSTNPAGPGDTGGGGGGDGGGGVTPEGGQEHHYHHSPLSATTTTTTTTTTTSSTSHTHQHPTPTPST